MFVRAMSQFFMCDKIMSAVVIVIVIARSRIVGNLMKHVAG